MHFIDMSEKCSKKQIFFIQTSTLIPCNIKTIQQISKVQKHGTKLVTWLNFLFYNFSSKPQCCPYKEADSKAVKVVNFATKWLNLYPHTVYAQSISQFFENRPTPRLDPTQSQCNFDPFFLGNLCLFEYHSPQLFPAMYLH